VLNKAAHKHKRMASSVDRSRLSRSVAPVLVVLGLVGGAQAGFGHRLRAGGTPASYTLRSGDTLSAVAARYGVSIDQLASANGIANIHRVYAGTRLSIPGATGATGPTGAGAAPAARPGSLSKLPDQLKAHPERLTLVPSFQKWSAAYGVPADLLMALSWMESGWQNTVVSSVSAYGVGQLTPATVDFVNDQLLGGQNLDPHNADQNIRMSSRYLRYLMDQSGGDVRSTLAGYFQGPGSVRRVGVLPVSKWYADTIQALRPLFT
jgi:soluble lytic murein transglycosylase-like protein